MGRKEEYRNGRDEGDREEGREGGSEGGKKRSGGGKGVGDADH